MNKETIELSFFHTIKLYVLVHYVLFRPLYYSSLRMIVN